MSMQTAVIEELKQEKELAPGALLDRAREVEDWVERRWLDRHGIVYTFLNIATEGPLTDDFFTPDQSPLPAPAGSSPAEWHNYENCGMTTGEYLEALLYRYEIEKDPQAMARARRCFEALKYIYDMGKQLEEGFLPKIYGDRFSDQTSSDQVLYAMLALDHFHRHATPVEKPVVSRMISEMIRFWVKRDYRYKYYYTEDMQWPLGRFTNLLLMASKHSDDPIFLREYHRLLAMGVNDVPLESRLAPKLSPDYKPTAYEREMGAYVIGELEGSVSMDVMELDYLLRNDPANQWAPNWRRSIKQVWDEAKMCLAPDGTMYVHILVDMKTLQPRRPEPAFFRPNEGNGDWDWAGFRYITGGRSADSAFIARAALQGHVHVPEPDMIPAARRVVRGLERVGMRSYYDPERMLPELRHRSKVYSGDCVGNWLWAYWLGRQQNVFSATE